MTKSHYEKLSVRWRAKHYNLHRKLWEKHHDSLNWLSEGYRKIMSGSLGGLMLLTGQMSNVLPPVHSNNDTKIDQKIDKKTFLISDLVQVLPQEMRPLSEDEESKISHILSRDFGIKIASELEGKKLNRNYGLIGQEQHLIRYPGDNLSTHFDSEDEAKLHWQHGMAPGLGAWRYFADSKEQLTKKDKDRERYYIAVQTFLSKDFTDRFAEYRDFYKYRKMLVVNPNNGRAVVADIADAGPAEWTGKHLGGSPEVMDYLQRVDGKARGPVLFFFIDDPDDKVELGPINQI